MTDIPQWDTNATYDTDDRVMSQGVIWLAVASSTGVRPGSDLSKWAVWGPNADIDTEGAPSTFVYGTPGDGKVPVWNESLQRWEFGDAGGTSGASGLLVEIPISTDAGDWTLNGAWTIAGGIATSTAVNDSAFLELPAAARSAKAGAIIVAGCTFDGTDAEFSVGVSPALADTNFAPAMEVALFDGTPLQINCYDADGSVVILDSPTLDADGGTPPVGKHFYAVHSLGFRPAAFIDGECIGSGKAAGGPGSKISTDLPALVLTNSTGGVGAMVVDLADIQLLVPGLPA